MRMERRSRGGGGIGLDHGGVAVPFRPHEQFGYPSELVGLDARYDPEENGRDCGRWGHHPRFSVKRKGTGVVFFCRQANPPATFGAGPQRVVQSL